MTNKELYAKASEAFPGDSSGILEAVRNAWCMGYDKALEDMGVKREERAVGPDRGLSGIERQFVAEIIRADSQDKKIVEIYEDLKKLGK